MIQGWGKPLVWTMATPCYRIEERKWNGQRQLHATGLRKDNGLGLGQLYAIGLRKKYDMDNGNSMRQGWGNTMDSTTAISCNRVKEEIWHGRQQLQATGLRKDNGLDYVSLMLQGCYRVKERRWTEQWQLCTAVMRKENRLDSGNSMHQGGGKTIDWKDNGLNNGNSILQV